MFGTADDEWLPRVALLLAVVAASSCIPAAAFAVAPAGSDGLLLVSYREGARGADLAHRAGAPLVADLPSLHLMVLQEREGAAAALAKDPRVIAVERDGLVHAAGVGWNGVGWNGVGWNGVGWNGVGWNGVGWNGVGWNGVGWNGVAWNGVGWNGVGWNGGAEGEPHPGWALEAIRAPEAWATGVPEGNRLVCMLDTGVDPGHPAIAGSLWPHALNLVEPGAFPHDDAGHGTHLAGIVAAARDGSWPLPGVAAPRLAVVKIMDADGHGRTSDAIRGLAWCGEQGAHVILMAFTEDAPTKAFRAAVRAAQKQGALLVASSGNGACDRCVSEPASLPGVLAVGAFGPDGARAGFMSEGPEIDLLAPGVHVTSAYPGGLLRAGSGTSQAAAFAAGVAALVWSKAPEWDAHRVAAHLERSADAEGRLDAAEAVRALPGVRG